MTHFIISNAGPLILATNYWQSEHAKGGLLYLSTNAGCFRLLWPDTGPAPDLGTPTYAIVSRGPWQGRDGLEVLFEDNSDSPYSLQLDARQADRLPAATDNGRTDLRLIVYRYRSGTQYPAMDLSAYYRVVSALPCLAPWVSSCAT